MHPLVAASAAIAVSFNRWPDCVGIRTTFLAIGQATAPRTWPSSGASPLVVLASQTKRSVKTRHKAAGWNPQFLLQILQLK